MTDQTLGPNSGLGAPVVARTINWLDLNIRAWGSEWRAPDKGAYEFSNGTKKDSTDQTTNGFYRR